MHILLWVPGIPEIIIILVVIILLFGGRKIPGLMKGIGKGIKEFKKARSGEPDSDSENLDKKD
ncbi:MAG: twin-arginine translocase TatA/TatE family subunit [Bacteroidota bacterium]